MRACAWCVRAWCMRVCVLPACALLALVGRRHCSGVCGRRWCPVCPRPGPRAPRSSLRFPGGSEPLGSPRVTAKKGSTRAGGRGATRLSVPQRVYVVVRRVLGERGLGVPRTCTDTRPELLGPRVPGGSHAPTALCGPRFPRPLLGTGPPSPAAGLGAVPAGCGRARGGPLLPGRTMRPLSGRARGGWGAWSHIRAAELRPPGRRLSDEA